MNLGQTRLRFAAFAAGMLFGQVALAAGSIEVLKTASCGCCIAWGQYLREAGFAVNERDLPIADLNAAKVDAGLKPAVTACHTARIDGYVIEGHVPVREIKRLLAERPDAIGLAVPDMPYGSPGMGEAGDDAEPYDVLLVRRDGKISVYATYP